jgi:hypothetical protein
MADLTSTTVAANYMKTAPRTAFGTRALRFITVTFDNGSDSDVDLTAAYASGTGAYSGSYTDSFSYYSKAVRALQIYFELYAVGTPSSTAFTIVVSDDTAQDSDADSHDLGGYGQAEAAVKAAVGIGAKAGLATKYNGAVTLATVSLQGASLS